MASQVLIISQADDEHLPFVQKHLDAPCVIVDPYNVIEGVELSFQYRAGKLVITYNGKQLTSIKSVWYRKPRPIWSHELPVDDKYRQYSETALLSHTRELYMHFRDAFWMSDYYAMRRAEFKSLQLEIAHGVGFKVPDTLATSDGDAAKAFVQARRTTIVKSQAYMFPKGPRWPMFFAQKIHRDESFDYSGLHLAPAIFQQAIDHDIDVRVTVVGNKVFAAAIKLSEMPAGSPVRDWRAAHYSGKMDISPYTLPTDIEEKCVTLVKRLGLVFGAIDLVRDKKGQLWFLENNPNGQWGFVEEITNQPIGKAVATLLDEGRI